VWRRCGYGSGLEGRMGVDDASGDEAKSGVDSSSRMEIRLGGDDANSPPWQPGDEVVTGDGGEDEL
jgi:hypothetical protein